MMRTATSANVRRDVNDPRSESPSDPRGRAPGRRSTQALPASDAAHITFIVVDGYVKVRRGIHVSPLRAGRRNLRWDRSDATISALARAMVSEALQDPEPEADLVRAFSTEVVAYLPEDHFEVTGADIIAWVQDLGTSEREDLREERRPRRLDELQEYDEAPEDPSLKPVSEAGGGVAEGFEGAEDALIEQASHAETGRDPLKDAFPPESESDRADAVYGDADDASPDDQNEDRS
jgi:hypothetical protein